MRAPDATHDPALRSWVTSANEPATDFPIQNLPFGVYALDANDTGRVGVAIGDQIVGLRALHAEGWLSGDGEVAGQLCAGSDLNGLLALGPRYWLALRQQLSELLREGSPAARTPGLAERILVSAASVSMRLPAAIGDYTDFYVGIHHATNVGAMFRPDNPLLPNYKWVPIGYHGRASSIVPSGTTVRRPSGQTKAADAAAPVVGPTRALDYEAEIGFLVGPGSTLGEPVPIGDAESHLFGVCLLNDWSARDIQTWEYQPLGPFLSKSFATTVSPWIVTLDALVPFRVAPEARPPGDPLPLPYLTANPGAMRLKPASTSRSMSRSGPPECATGVTPRSGSAAAMRATCTGPRAIAHPPHQQRLQPPPRRPARQRHDLRPHTRRPRLPPRVDPARHRAGGAPRRRDAWLPRGRRRGGHARRLRAAGSRPDRLR